MRRFLHNSNVKICIMIVLATWYATRPFPSCFEPCYECEASCIIFVMQNSFHSYANKTNFHIESFALGLAFVMRFTATQK